MRKGTKVAATTKWQPNITRPLRIITVKRPNITTTVIMRRPATMPTWRMRMDCTRPIMGTRPRNTTRRTTRNTTNKNGKRPSSGDLAVGRAISACRSHRHSVMTGLRAPAAPILLLDAAGPSLYAFPPDVDPSYLQPRPHNFDDVD